MILLSSLLGPAKPPVASQADVTSAGGLFHLVEYAGSLFAESFSGTEAIPISDSERCLICLSDYEAAEEVRQLAKCKHIYHKDCIDQAGLFLAPSRRSNKWLTCISQWLTTGRNSCPLCRGQGVAESSHNRENNSAPASEAAA
jgi:RING-like zinc finger